MDDDDESFYDSLDEEQNFEVRDTEVVKFDVQIQTDAVEIPPWKVRKESLRGKTKIPFYVGEKTKEELKLNKKSTQTPSKSNIQLSSSCVSCVNHKINALKLNHGTLTSLTFQKPTNSYTNIFYHRNGRRSCPTEPLDTIIGDTVRSVYGNSTRRSFSTCQSCYSLNNNNGPSNDTPSMYAKFMPERYIDENNERRSTSCDFTSTISTKSEVSYVDVENLQSVSEIYVHNKSKKIIEKSKYRVRNYNILGSPSMGSLGPDLEATRPKLERLKRQQEYGKKASIRNRVKLEQYRLKLRNSSNDIKE